MAGDRDKSRLGECLFLLIVISQPFTTTCVYGTWISVASNEELQGIVKTIQSDEGDVIDCIDIYKQPAFNHPLLSNHTLPMKPLVSPGGVEPETTNSMHLPQSWLKSGGCPEGTAPIARTQIFNQHYGTPAIMQLNQSLQINPGVNLEVNLAEQKTRFFIYWTGSCYNLNCPGFVQTNHKFALGSLIAPLSTYGSDQREIVITIRKDLGNGNWWLELQGQVLGYWPSSIFSRLADSSDTINWAGEITNKHLQGHHTSTQMGIGHFPNEGFGKSSYFHGIKYFDGSGTLKNPEKLNNLCDKAAVL